mmetsp:Transcript_4966/g.11030  ORF Transcript_4966/g.11030 Transcript_4966/m.11030 type:complete len:515 (+) Transcript_4966:72-1616(+)
MAGRYNRLVRVPRRYYHEVSYPRHGKDPKDVLSYRSDPRVNDRDPPSPEQEDGATAMALTSEISGDELVRVEMMHAPWNPADINTVQGRYPSPYPSSSSWKNLRIASDRCVGRYFNHEPVIGSEGWGRITHSSLSPSSSSFPPGTLVTLGLPGLGTLRSSLWVPGSAVLPVPEFVWERLGPAGCSLFQLGGTALRLLSDFVVPEPGDVVVQNAGNSGVGFMASQLAASSLLFGTSKKEESLNNDKNNGKESDDRATPVMVSIIRRRGKSRESFDESVDYLTRAGKNAFVVAEEDFFLPIEGNGNGFGDTSNGKKETSAKIINETALRTMRQRLRDLSPTGSLPKLALNAVGGDSARLLMRLLEPSVGSTIVTYGGMSGGPVQVATPQLIFSDVRAVGYWHSRWMVRQHQQEREHRNNENKIGDNDAASLNKTKNGRASVVDTLSQLVLVEDLKCPPARVVRLKDLREGLLWQANQSDRSSIDCDDSSRPPIRGKLIWDCSEDQDEETELRRRSV